MRLTVHMCLIAIFVALAAPPLSARQSGAGVTMAGQVSAVVAVSAGPPARVVKGDARVSAEAAVMRELLLSLSGPRGGETQVDIPVRLRSNAAFALIASCTTRGVTLS